MKELSIEEKAKRYDEAIEVARKIKNGEPINVPDGTLVPVAIFPELRESEDERMKSAAIEFVIQNKSFNYYLGISKDDVVTWINRQGKQKSAWTEEDKNMLKWVIGYLENKMLNTPMSEERIACKNAIAWFKKLEGEQKPAEQNVDNRKLCDIVIEELSKYSGNEADKAPWALDSTGVRYPLYFAELGVKWQKEQKSTWSEEDEAKIKSIIALLKDPAVCSMDGNKGIIDASIRYLKSLKDRVQPQLQWKPSEQDILLLERIFDGKLDPRDFQASLQGIIEQLKKLKEE